MFDIAVVGTGYVGLTTGVCLAKLGHRVICLDVDSTKIEMLNAGAVPIIEESIPELVMEARQRGVLTFSSDLQLGVSSAGVVFLCLPTPQGDDGSADLSYIEGMLPLLKAALKEGAVLVNKSTVPVGTAVHVARQLNRPDVQVVSNPEFLRQGTAVRDFLNPTRVVIGGDDELAVETVASLYSGIEAPVLRMKSASAEALKYAANAFLATKLTFINAMADICEAVGADIFDVAQGIGMDPRIGRDMLNAGPGWGGSCFPKDTRALVSIAANHGYDFALLRGVIETNDSHYQRIAQKAIDMCSGSVTGKSVAAWGLTFKAGTDDLRDSPAIKVLSLLREKGATIVAYEPTASGAYPMFPWIEIVEDPLIAVMNADVLLLLTEWGLFRDINPVQVKASIGFPRVVDARNHLDRDVWREAGFEYVGVGR